MCVGPINTFGEAFADEQLRARDMLVEGEIEGAGPWKHVGNPIKLSSGAKELVKLPPPRLGEHTKEILRAAGYSEEEIEELRTGGAV